MTPLTIPTKLLMQIPVQMTVQTPAQMTVQTPAQITLHSCDDNCVYCSGPETD